MKKLIAGAVAGAALLASALPAFAGAKNGTHVHWTWPSGVQKSAYFQVTGSGLVNAWTYDHPDLDDARFIFKPVSKFKNATECDEGWLRERTDWTPKGIWNTADSPEDKAKIENIFGTDLNKEYLFCAYPME